MKIWKKMLALGLCAATAFSVSACSGDSSEGKTVLEVAVHNGGVGSEWLRSAADRFAESVADKSYAEGKNGVKINITPGNGLGKASMDSDAYNVYFVERLDTFNLIQNNLLMDLTEIVETEESGRLSKSVFILRCARLLKATTENIMYFPVGNSMPVCLTMWSRSIFAAHILPRRVKADKC